MVTGAEFEEYWYWECDTDEEGEGDKKKCNDDGVVITKEHASIVIPATLTDPGEDGGTGAVLAACIVLVPGSILGHPVFSLVGWIGGIGCFLFGFFAFLVHQDNWALVLMLVGAIGGPGCVTVGHLLHKYDAYLRYYSKRMWRSVLANLQADNSSNRSSSAPTRSGEESSITTGLLRGTPWAKCPIETIVWSLKRASISGKFNRRWWDYLSATLTNKDAASSQASPPTARYIDSTKRL
jgi:hypothetical protein